MPQWRAEQKEPQAREALARLGIERFVSEQSCPAMKRLGATLTTHTLDRRLC